MKKLDLLSDSLPKIENLYKECVLCGHSCLVKREEGKKGICNASQKAAVYSYATHHGEEPPLSGSRGSGTIFFTHCNLKCVYCQNYEFSQESNYEEIEIEELARRMMELERIGCHNINFVSPTHYAYHILKALEIALQKGLKIPIVYNTGGYDNPELIKLLDGIIEVYLPDARYSDNKASLKYSSASNYRDVNRKVIKEMYRQVGFLKVDSDGVAKKGIIVRLLILPKNISGTIETLNFLKNEVSDKIFLSVMSQYCPTYKAPDYPDISRPITMDEYRKVVREVERLGFENGWIQGYQAESERFLGTKIKQGHFRGL